MTEDPSLVFLPLERRFLENYSDFLATTDVSLF
jgi:hypothetical protein